MREIKFRCWDKNNKNMVYQFLESSDHHGYLDYSVCIDDGGYLHVENYNGDSLELMQFTGLLDRNGKEIYEGDVIETNGIENCEKALIIFHDGAFVADFEEFNFIGWEHLNGLDMTVIGNIYQNKDLLNEINK